MNRKSSTLWLSAGAIALASVLAGGQLIAHESAHNYTYLSSGTVKVGREEDCGGMLSWISEETGQAHANSNVVCEQFAPGASIQVGIFDALMDWNPTQGGDGKLTPDRFSQCDLWHADSNYIYSRCIPLLFYNNPNDPDLGPRPVTDGRIHMWTELLPNSNGRAFSVRSAWEYWGTHIGGSSQQELPAQYSPYQLNNFAEALHYTGSHPWTLDTLTTSVSTVSLQEVLLRNTEHWVALVQAASPNWGIASMAQSGIGSLMHYDSGHQEPPSDHEWSIRLAESRTRFPIGKQSWESEQFRCVQTTYYLGNVTDARSFFATYKPVETGSFSDTFDDGNYWGWDANTIPTQVINNAVVMGPDTNWVNDLSLVGKTWSDATYSVDAKLNTMSGASWYGMSFRKTGQNHSLWDPQVGCYTAYFTPQGSVVLVSTDNGVLGSGTISNFDSLSYHNLKVDAQGYTFNVYVDQNLIFTTTDAAQSFPTGYISLNCDRGVTASFDNVNVVANGGDTTPPQAVSNLVTTGADNLINISWTNPPDTDWRWTRIVRKPGSTAPIAPDDGFPCYEGKLQSYVDVDVQTGQTYSYAAFTCDHAYNWSSGVTSTCPASGTWTQSWTASKDYGCRQGLLNSWYYRKLTGTTYADLNWRPSPDFTWTNLSAYAYIGQNWQVPNGEDSARVWRAPVAMTIRIVGNAHKLDTTGGDGVNVSILKGTQQIWPSGGSPQFIAYNDAVGYDHDVNVSVAGGDEICFRVNMVGNTANDKTSWDPTITSVSSAAPIAQFSASQTTIGTGMPLTFTNTSTGNGLTCQWDFNNDGVFDATSQGLASVSNTYSTPGVYSVRLRVTSADGSDDEIRSQYITVRQSTTTTFYSGTEDGWVLEASQSSNTGGSANSTDATVYALRLGDDSQNRQYKSIVSFDTSAITTSKTIVSATLKLKRGGVLGIDPIASLGPCRVDIKSGTFGAQAIEASDFEATADRTNVVDAGMSDPANNGDDSVGDLNSSGRAMIKRDGITQLRIYLLTGDNGNQTREYIGFYSAEDSTQGNRPRLVVTYY